MNARLIQTVFILLSVLLFSCSSPNVAGATSETTNGVVVSIAMNQHGKGVPNADVYLYEEHSLRKHDEQAAEPYTRTDSEGSFAIDTLDTLNYLIEVVDSVGDRVMSSIKYNSGSKDYTLEKEELRLEPSGRFRGKVNKLPIQNVLVQIYGLGRTAQADAEGVFRFDDLPEGDISFRIMVDSVVHYERETVTIKSNEEASGEFEVNKGKFAEDSVRVSHFLSLNGIDDSLFSEIVTVRDGKVRGINADTMNIDTLPPELFDIPFRKFSVAGNRIRVIPEEIGNLNSAEYVDLSGNGLTSLPDALSLMDSCTTLDIEDNELTTLPEAIMDMPSIQAKCVSLNNNRLNSVKEPLKSWIDRYADNSDWAVLQR